MQTKPLGRICVTKGKQAGVFGGARWSGTRLSMPETLAAVRKPWKALYKAGTHEHEQAG